MLPQRRAASRISAATRWPTKPDGADEDKKWARRRLRGRLLAALSKGAERESRLKIHRNVQELTHVPIGPRRISDEVVEHDHVHSGAAKRAKVALHVLVVPRETSIIQDEATFCADLIRFSVDRRLEAWRVLESRVRPGPVHRVHHVGGISQHDDDAGVLDTAGQSRPRRAGSTGSTGDASPARR